MSLYLYIAIMTIYVLIAVFVGENVILKVLKEIKSNQKKQEEILTEWLKTPNNDDKLTYSHD